jgi:phosphatidylserine/phosphatidylglycerophosphate/cardiolipin synthase-like enzyme
VAFVVIVGAALWGLVGLIAPSPPLLAAAHQAQATPAPVTGIFIEPGDGRAPLLDEIEAARETIDLEVYIVTDDVTLAALEGAQRRGVRVRVILEQHPFGGGGGQEAIFARLQGAGIAVRWGNPAFRFTHIKAMTVDGAVAVIMNQNITSSAFTTNRDFGVVTDEPAAVRTAASIFEADWIRGAEPHPEPLVVSPTNARQRLLALVQGAQRSLDIYAEVLRDPELLDALAAAEARGVRVRIVISPSPDFVAEQERLSAAGVEIRLLGNLYVHAKVIIADGERAFVGSQNLSATSLDQNRELGIIVEDAINLARLGRTFEIDFRAGAPLETP